MARQHVPSEEQVIRDLRGIREAKNRLKKYLTNTDPAKVSPRIKQELKRLAESGIGLGSMPRTADATLGWLIAEATSPKKHSPQRHKRSIELLGSVENMTAMDIVL